MSIFIDGIIFSLQRQGGISVYTHQLLQHLAQERVSTVLGLEMPTASQIEVPKTEALAVVRRPARTLERYRRCVVPDAATVFHSSYYRLPARRDLPSVVTVHDFIYERFSRGLRRQVHMTQKHAAIRAAQALICISEATRQDLLEWVGVRPGQQVHVIHNGVSETFRPLPDLAPAPRPYALFVGERGGYKNFALMLRALELLPELELHCVGGGTLRPQELEGISPATRSRVRHLGFVTEEALNEHYNRAACLVYPSSYEGFGIPVVEAMRAGCPVVCIDCRAVLEIGGEALIRAEAAEAGALAAAVMKACDAAARASLIAAGLVVACRYAWGTTHQQTLQVYSALNAGRL